MFVRTVLGDIDPAELGVTSGHDHLFVLQGHYTNLPERVLIEDYGKTRDELVRFRKSGGGAVVDLQPFGAGRSPELLKNLSEETGVRIVAATGLHKSAFYRPVFWSFEASGSELADLFSGEIERGMYEYDRIDPFAKRGPVRAGVIKIATENGARVSARVSARVGALGRFALNAYERKVFDAAAEAHKRTGAPIFTHTELSAGGLEQADYLTGKGVRPESIVIGHMDRVIDVARNLELGRRGVFQAYDTIARFKYHGDEEEAALIEAMVDARLGDRVLLGMDSTPERFLSYGGSFGLDYFILTFSKLLLARGVTEDQVERMLVHNPRDALVFKGNEGGKL
jgi:predicted metal-dependent phosphotriesterase family hydrolase